MESSYHKTDNINNLAPAKESSQTKPKAEMSAQDEEMKHQKSADNQENTEFGELAEDDDEDDEADPTKTEEEDMLSDDGADHQGSCIVGADGVIKKK